MFKKVLVAFDGSEHAKNALRSAVSLGEGQITVLCVQHTMASQYARLASLAPLAVSQLNVDIEELLDVQADRLRSQIAEITSELKVETDIQVKNGDPANEICKFAKEQNYDLIVMGSRGLGAMAELAIGSVSHKVIQHSVTPALIVK